MATLPTVTKTYDFNGINQRITYSSLNDCSAQAMYMTKVEAVTHCAWTVLWSCDGTTGPSSSSDHTDRWSSKAAATTRGANSSAVQSWIILTDGDGGQLLLAYQGSTDDVFRISYSPSGAYAIAGTATHQPTSPSDELVIATGITMVGTTTSGDRLVHVVGSTDAKHLRVWIYRAGTLQRHFFREAIDKSSSNTVLTFSPAVWVGNSSTASFGAATHMTMGAAGQTNGADGSGMAWVAGALHAIGGGGKCYLNTLTNPWTPSAPEMQAASPLTDLFIASADSGATGEYGRRIDCWYPYCNGIAQGDPFGSAQFVCLGQNVVPWDGSSTVVLT